jgi:plasmid replication initiation protein
MASTKLTVVKSNDLINASYKLSLNEQRILLACIAQLDSREEIEQRVFTISVSEISDLVTKDLSGGGAYTRIKDSTERMARRWIILTPTGDKRKHQVKIRWVSRIDYYENDGKVGLSFTPDVVKYLTQLKGAFTQYKLEYVTHFKSSHSIRIYELLVQWMSSGEREIRVEELRDKLALGDKYPAIKDLKKRVLDPAVADIRKYSNIWVTYGQRKTGRTVTSFQFKFRLKESDGTSGQKKMATHEPAKINQLKKGSTTKARPGESMAEYLVRMKRESK